MHATDRRKWVQFAEKWGGPKAVDNRRVIELVGEDLHVGAAHNHAALLSLSFCSLPFPLNPLFLQLPPFFRYPLLFSIAQPLAFVACLLCILSAL